MTVDKAVIIGGGIGGLSAALSLHQRGIDVSLHEQAEKDVHAGAGLMVWGNAVNVLKQLDVATSVIGRGFRVRQGVVRDQKGRVLMRLNLEELERFTRAPTIGIHRADLLSVLLRELPASSLHHGSLCTDFAHESDHARAYFSDGSRDAGDVLIGANGIHSMVRRKLFPDVGLSSSGYVAWRGVATITEDVTEGMSSETWGVGSRFGMLRINANQIYWFATANLPPFVEQDPHQRQHQLLERFRGWHHPIQQLIAATPTESILRNDIFDLPPMSQWSRGRVVLVGDAAHATTPNLGQGACMAMESALVLAKCLAAEPDVAQAFGRYEQLRRPRTAQITHQSWLFGRVGQMRNPLLCRARNALASVMPGSIMDRNLHRAAAFEG